VVEIHVKCHIASVQKIIGEIFLDDATLIAAADDESVDAAVAVGLEDVSQHRLAAHLHHELGPQMGLFGQAGS